MKKKGFHNALVSAIKRGGGDERNNKGEQTARGNLSLSTSSTPDLPEDRCLLVLCPGPSAIVVRHEFGAYSGAFLLLKHTEFQKANGKKDEKTQNEAMGGPTKRNAQFEISATLRMFDDMLQRRLQRSCSKRSAASQEWCLHFLTRGWGQAYR